MLTDAKLCSSTTDWLLLALRLLGFGVATTPVSVVGMAAMLGKNAFNAAIDDKSVVLSIISPAIDGVEHDAVEVNGSSLDAVATLTRLWLSGKLR